MTIELSFTPSRPPRAHQWRAMEKARGRPAFAYFMEMGTGKSKVAIDEMLQLYSEGVIDRALFVAGAGSYDDFLHKHLPENVPNDIRVLAHLWDGGNSATERQRLSQFANGPSTLRVLIMNIEAFASSRHGETVAMNFVRGGKTLFVVDESTNIKNEGARRTAVAIAIGKSAVVRRIMTGSPITKNPMDLWGQLQFLGVHHSFGDNYFSFRARFCTLTDIRVGAARPTPGQPARSKTVKKITGYRNLDRLTSLLDRHSFRVLKEECLDLPPKIYETFHVDLTDEQKKLYRDMAKLATTEIEDGVWSTAKNAMGRLAKLHQIILGHLVDEDGNVHGIPTKRPGAVCDLVEEAGDKVIIWCAYRRDVTLVLEELGKRFPGRQSVRYDGLVKTEDRAEAKRLFQDGDTHCFVGTAATGGIGVTLTASSNTIYYSNTFSLLHRLQSEDRNHRDGQTRAVTYVDMFTPRTVEQHIVNLLLEKKNIADMVTGDGVRQWLEWAK